MRCQKNSSIDGSERLWHYPAMRVLLAIVMVFAAVRPAVSEPCRQALVLALDVSGSVNEEEFRQQVSGVAAALDAPDVRALLLEAGLPPVSLAVFEWSSQNHQYLVLPWVTVVDDASLDAAIARIRGHKKVRAGLKTALGTALGFASTLLANKAECWRRTIDVSGDGKNNIGASPSEIYGLPGFAGVTVNALVVVDPSSRGQGARAVGVTPEDLARYFDAEVIRGQAAFTIIANGYEDYARAMRLKLMRELSVPVVVEGPHRSVPPG